MLGLVKPWGRKILDWCMPRITGRVQWSSGLLTPLGAAEQIRVWSIAVTRTIATKDDPQPYQQYYDDPIGFARDILGKDLWSVKDYPVEAGIEDEAQAAGQVEILEALRDNPFVSVAACYASGKTFTAAVAVLWWLYTRRPALVVTTAPTGRQVRTLLWREIRKLHKGAKVKLPGRLLQTRLEIADDWLGFGFASDAPNSVAGLHEAKNVLFIEDEAAGMQAEIVEGFEGITASENSAHLKIGNPIAVDGPFFDSHMHPVERERWVRLCIDAENTPNVREKRAKFPGLVTWEWVQDKVERWLKRGLLHLWNTKVKGRFFVTAAEKVIPKAWIEQAQRRWGTVETEGPPRYLGVDPAGGGQDETEVWLREVLQVRQVDNWQMEHTMEQAIKIALLAMEHGVQEIRIDRTGLGQGIYFDLLHLQSNGWVTEDGEHLFLSAEITVHGIGMQTRPYDAETYARKADEVQFDLRWALDPSNPDAIAIPPDDAELADQLHARGWKVDDTSRKVVCESKLLLRKRGVGSPDKADAVSLLTVVVYTEEIQLI